MKDIMLYTYIFLTMQKYQIFKVPQEIRSTCEIQLRTQLQYAVKSILHRYYERDRIEFKNDRTDWRWQHNKPRFITNYMGHVLHFLDGIIVKIKKGD